MAKKHKMGSVTLELNIDDIVDAVAKEIDAAMFEAGKVLADTAQAKAASFNKAVADRMYVVSKGHEYGRPHKKYRIEANKRGKGSTYVGSSHPLFAITEFGSMPHRMRLKRAQAFQLEDGTFVKGEIMHPGTPAQPYMRPAFDEKKGEAADKATSYLRDKLGKL